MYIIINKYHIRKITYSNSKVVRYQTGWMLTESWITIGNRNISTSRVLLTDDNESVKTTNTSQEKHKQIGDCNDKIHETTDSLKAINHIHAEKVEDVIQLLDNVTKRDEFISDNVADVSKRITKIIDDKGTRADNLESELGDKNTGYNTENVKTYLQLKQDVVLEIVESVDHAVGIITSDPYRTLSNQEVRQIRNEVENLAKLSTDSLVLIGEQNKNLRELQKAEEVTHLESSTPLPIDADVSPKDTSEPAVVEQDSSSKHLHESLEAEPNSAIGVKRKLHDESNSEDVTDKKLKLDNNESSDNKSKLDNNESSDNKSSEETKVNKQSPLDYVLGLESSKPLDYFDPDDIFG